MFHRVEASWLAIGHGTGNSRINEAGLREFAAEFQRNPSVAPTFSPFARGSSARKGRGNNSFVGDRADSASNKLGA